MPEAAKKIESLGEYKGYPILDVRIEWRGLNGGLTDAVRVGSKHVTDLEEQPFIASKGRKIAERYDVVFDDDDEMLIEGVTLVQIFSAIGADFADEKLVGAAVHRTMNLVREAEALRKSGQGSLGFTLPDPNTGPTDGLPDAEDEAALAEVKAEKGGKIRQIRRGVLDDEGASGS